MSKPRTVRLEEWLDPEVENYMEENNLNNFNQLVNLALKDFITNPQTIELKPIAKSKWTKQMKKAYAKSKKAMDELK